MGKNIKRKTPSGVCSSNLLDPYPKDSNGPFVAVARTNIESLKADLRVARSQRDSNEKQWQKAGAVAKIYKDAVDMIGKICRSTKHKDPLLDILCECNRAERLLKELQQKTTPPLDPSQEDHPWETTYFYGV